MARIISSAGDYENVGEELQPRIVNIVMYRGDDFSMTVSMSSLDGTPINMAGWTGRAMAKKTGESVNIDIVIASDGLSFDFALTSVAVAAMTGDYSYDVEFTEPNGRVRTYLQGKISIKEDITR